MLSVVVVSNRATDNGSVYMKHFDQEFRGFYKVHWHTFPKPLRLNAHITTRIYCFLMEQYPEECKMW